MSLFRPGGQFDDAEDEGASAEQKLQGEIDLARVAGSQSSAASRLSAATRLGALNFSPGGALARAAADRNSTSDATASYLSLLQNAGGESHASPYYQRQRYRPAYLNAQSPYATLPSTTEASLAYARRAGTYAGYHASSGKQEGNTPPGYPNHYASPQRDFTSYYQRQAQDLSSAALLDRAYQLQDNKVLPGPTVPTSALQYLAKSQSTPKPAPGVTATTTASSTAKAVNTPRGRGGGRGTARGGRGRGSSRGGRGGNRSPKTPITTTPEKKESELDSQRWYSGCVPLGLPEDKFWLSELQVYLRSNFAEAFGATEADIAAPMHGRNKPIALGQVGIRCMHCRNDPPSERGQQATSYPSLISGIYNSVQQMLRLHFDCCLSMPAEVRQKIEQLKVSSSARGGRKQYWIDSAKRLGLVDTPHGIHFGRDPYGPLPPLSGPSGTAEEEQKSKLTLKSEGKEEEKKTGDEEAIEVPQVEHYPLVLPEDQPLISDYLYLTLEQMSPCNLMEADKVGCYKGRKVGFPGLACKHCVGQAGCGRYFPASEASLSQTTTSQTIMNHVRNCRRCPIEIRENLELMKRARMGPDGKRADKPKHGGRKVFFHRLWCRIQRIPLSDDEGGKKKNSRKKKEPKKTVKKRQLPPKFEYSEAEEDDDQRDEDTENTSDETETEQEQGSSDDERNGEFEQSPKYITTSKGRVSKKKGAGLWFDGCVRLTKTDDPHWLSEMQCYVRSDLVEVFSHQKKDVLDGYGGRKEPGVGQVGIRCVFCKTLPRTERSSGCIYFPDTLAAIHTKIGDMIRLHFPSCPAMPDDVKSTFRSNRGFGAKADGDSQQYWIDAARDIGLCNSSPGGDAWGIRFHRDPLQPSPADNLDRENAGATSYHFRKASLVRAEDKGMCTDHVMLLLRQVKPCRFKKSDRRGGPSARGRDRVIGFPGICCKHCSSKNNFGRYFPVSAKNLTDNTANSLQAHMLSCSRCPDAIKASLAFLMHRSSLQKAELSGSWKKSFFKHVWERLHLERAWSKTGDRKDDDEDEEGEEDDKSISADEKTLISEGKIENSQSNSDSEEDDACEEMGDLIKAAAVWLSEQDATNEAMRGKGNRARALAGKRPLPFSLGSRGRNGGLPSKRKKVSVN